MIKKLGLLGLLAIAVSSSLFDELSSGVAALEGGHVALYTDSTILREKRGGSRHNRDIALDADITILREKRGHTAKNKRSNPLRGTRDLQRGKRSPLGRG